MKHIGNLEIRNAADAKKYAGLTEVTGDLYIRSDAKLDALTSVGGYRDVEQYRDMPPTTRKTPQEWAVVYRRVTGACRFGTEDFMARKGKLEMEC